MTDKNAAALARKRWKNVPKEARTKLAKAMVAARWEKQTPEMRSGSAKKGHETRKLRKLGQS